MALTKVIGVVSPFVAGMIMPWAGPISTIPNGWLHINSQTLNISDFQNLYAAIGNTWGGDSTTFKLPSADRIPVMAGTGYSPGQKGGQSLATTSSNGGFAPQVTIDPATLSISQMPSHAHNLKRSYWGGRDGVQTGMVTDSNTESGYGRGTTLEGGSGSHTHTATCTAASDHTHTVDTRSPYSAMPFMIKT